MTLHGAVFEGGKAVVPPGPGQVDRAGAYPFFAGQAAIAEEKALRLLQCVGGGGDVADVPGVPQGADLAVFKQGFAAAEDEIHGALNAAVRKPLPQEPVLPQLVAEEAVVALYEIRGQRAQEQGVLGGGQGAPGHGKIVRVYAQGHLLPLFLRLEGIVDNGQILHGDAVGTDCHGPGPEGDVLPTLLVQLLCIVIKNEDCVFCTLPNNRQTRRADHHLLMVNSGSQMDKSVFWHGIEGRLKIILRGQKSLNYHNIRPRIGKKLCALLRTHYTIISK